MFVWPCIVLCVSPKLNRWCLWTEKKTNILMKSPLKMLIFSLASLSRHGIAESSIVCGLSCFSCFNSCASIGNHPFLCSFFLFRSVPFFPISFHFFPFLSISSWFTASYYRGIDSLQLSSNSLTRFQWFVFVSANFIFIRLLVDICALNNPTHWLLVLSPQEFHQKSLRVW